MKIEDIEIGIYKGEFDKKFKPFGLLRFYEGVKDGLWQDDVLPIRNAKTDKQKKELKSKLERISIHGIFSSDGRKSENLVSYTGIVDVDIDCDLQGEELETLKKKLSSDPYTLSLFTTASGKRVSAHIKINPSKFNESVDAIIKYYFEKYGLPVDLAIRNVTFLRSVSFDPDIFWNFGSKKWDIFLKKEEVKIPEYKGQYFTNDNTETIFKRIDERGVDITGGYFQWVNCAFALAHQFGEAGEDYFLRISRHSEKYKEADAKRQFKQCLKHKPSSNRICTISTLIYYAKESGIDVSFPQTQEWANISIQQRRSGVVKKEIVKYLVTEKNASEKDAESLVEQVFSQPEVSEEKLPAIVRVERFVKDFHNDIRRNQIDMKLYNKDGEMNDNVINSVYMDCCRKLNQDISFDTFFRALHVREIPEFNPLEEFFNTYKSSETKDLFALLTQCLNCKQPYDYTYKILKKWLVGAVAGIYGEPNPIMLILVGEQFSGKTSFFEQLLPKHLESYFVIPNWKKDYDLSIQVATKWLVLDDEFEAVSKAGLDKLKSLITSKEVNFSLKYAKFPITKKRLCSFCGTSDKRNILADEAGNRRFVVLELTDRIDFNLLETIKKSDLWFQANAARNSGFDYKISIQDVAEINKVADSYRVVSVEEDYILKIYQPCEKDDGEFLSNAEITSSLMGVSNFRNMKNEQVGKLLKTLGFISDVKKIDKATRRGYWVKRNSYSEADKFNQNATSPVKWEEPKF